METMANKQSGTLTKLIPVVPTLLVTAVVSVAAVMVISKKAPPTGAQTALYSMGKQPPTKPHTLRAFAEKARSQGRDKIFIPAPVEYPGTDDAPETILSHATAVIAQPVDSYTYAPNDEDIVTWYKFKVIETLKEGATCRRCATHRPPNELLPIAEDEFLLYRYGGTLNIDGVEVTRGESGFPPFSKNKKHLLFLMKGPDGSVSLVAGRSGTYTVTPEGVIEPMDMNRHPLKEAIEQRFSNSAEQLKQHLKQPRS
jgi:hypothetical protein